MANEFRVKNGIIIDEVSSSSGNLTLVDGTVTSDQNLLLDVTGDITLDADGADVFFKDNGVQFGKITKHSSGQLAIHDSANNEAIRLVSGGSVNMPNDLVVAGDLNITGEISASVKGNTITPATAAINLVTSGSSSLQITIDAIDGTLLLDGHDKIEMRSGGASLGFDITTANSGDVVFHQNTNAKDFVFTSDGGDELLRIHDDSTSGGGMKLRGDGSNLPVFLIENVSNDATGGSIKFNVNRGQDAADNDVLGTLLFSGYDDNTPDVQDYAKIFGSVLDASHGAEKGKITAQVATYAGNMTTGLTIDGTTGDGVVNVTLGAGATSTTTVSGNLTVLGTTTQINSTSLTVEDAIIELGLVDGAAPSSDTAIDFGIIANYHDGSNARKSAFFWDETHQGWSVANIVSESGQVLTPSGDDIDFHLLYDDNKFFKINVNQHGAATLSATGNSGDATQGDITLDAKGDVHLNADSGIITFSDDTQGFGSLSHSSGVLLINSLADTGMELRSERAMTFFVDHDADSSDSAFTFATKDTTGPDLTGVDNESQPIAIKYKSHNTVLGQAQFGSVQNVSGADGVIFTYSTSDFAIAEVTIHLTDGTTDQVNKMLVCADSGGSAINYSNYSILYSDGSTELGTCSATISSTTVSVKVDADDNDNIYYSVVFLK